MPFSTFSWTKKFKYHINSVCRWMNNSCRCNFYLRADFMFFKKIASIFRKKAHILWTGNCRCHIFQWQFDNNGARVLPHLLPSVQIYLVYIYTISKHSLSTYMHTYTYVYTICSYIYLLNYHEITVFVFLFNLVKHSCFEDFASDFIAMLWFFLQHKTGNSLCFWNCMLPVHMLQ